MDYPPIEGHGLIGDLQTAALVAQDGTIDWFCSPRFDSPSLFGSLLDASRGGFCRLRPERDDFVARQLYLPGTPILITRFMSPEGVGELLDFMPVTGDVAVDRHSIVRLMRIVRGHGRFVLECEPGFDYARAPHQTTIGPHGVTFTSGGTALSLNLARNEVSDRIERTERGVRVLVEAGVGDSGGMILSAGPEHTARTTSLEEIRGLYDETRDFWRSWVGRSTYRGRWRENVERSAMTLKLMTYAPTGALVAAPTTGLPELVGGARNWDYRYTWIRDASFSIQALLGLGYCDEAVAFLHWMRDRLTAGPEQIMYRIDGSTDLHESTLDHLDGYRSSRPVRIGNDANGQLQLDISGEVMDAIYRAHQSGLRPAYKG